MVLLRLDGVELAWEALNVSYYIFVAILIASKQAKKIASISPVPTADMMEHYYYW